MVCVYFGVVGVFVFENFLVLAASSFVSSLVLADTLAFDDWPGRLVGVVF
jgi:hypothetical protein